MSRILSPRILETKQELLAALKAGQLKTSKYNLLNEKQRLYVEMVVFGGYTGEQAVKCIDPSVRNPLAIANRIASDPNVQETLEELSIAKDRKFTAEISSARDLALQKLQYIMVTSKDEALQATCAKVILDKAEAAMKNKQPNEEGVGSVSFKIQVENLYTGGAMPASSEPVIIPIDAEVDEVLYNEREQLREEVKKEKKALKELKSKTNPSHLPINPDTGLPYTIAYEGINNYNISEPIIPIPMEEGEDW
jgi:hypothetical protein